MQSNPDGTSSRYDRQTHHIRETINGMYDTKAERKSALMAQSLHEDECVLWYLTTPNPYSLAAVDRLHMFDKGMSTTILELVFLWIDSFPNSASIVAEIDRRYMELDPFPGMYST